MTYEGEGEEEIQVKKKQIKETIHQSIYFVTGLFTFRLIHAHPQHFPKSSVSVDG